MVLGAVTNAQLSVVWGAIATGVVGVLAALVAVAALFLRWRADSAALVQRSASDDRAEWWRRTQWAIDRTVDPSPAVSSSGLLVLTELIESPLATADEKRLLGDVAALVLDSMGGEA